MGQSTHLYTTAGLARYVSTIANSGTCYDLTLVKSITDSAGSVLEDNSANVHNTFELPQELWDTIHAGMRGVVQNHAAFSATNAPAFNGTNGLAVAVRPVRHSRVRTSRTTDCSSVMHRMMTRRLHLLCVLRTVIPPEMQRLSQEMSFLITLSCRMRVN